MKSFSNLTLACLLACAAAISSANAETSPSLQRTYVCHQKDLMSGDLVPGFGNSVLINGDEKGALLMWKKWGSQKDATPLTRMPVMKYDSQESYANQDSEGRLKFSFEVSSDKKTGVFIYRSYSTGLTLVQPTQSYLCERRDLEPNQL